jgi:hypothetical protein
MRTNKANGGFSIMSIGVGMWIGSWLGLLPPLHDYLPWPFVLSYPVMLGGVYLFASRNDQLLVNGDAGTDAAEILRLACEWADLRRGILSGETPEMAEIAQKLMALTLPTSKASSPSPVCSRGVL